MYQLNRIYNVDSYLAVKDFPDCSVDCIYIDAPYLYNKRGISSKRRGVKMSSVYNEIKDICDGFDYSIFDDFKRIMKKTNIFIWCSMLQVKDIIDYWMLIKDIKLQILFWKKTNAFPLNNSLVNDVEICLWFRSPGVKVNGNYHNKMHCFIGETNRKDKKEFGHPTIKPYECVKNHIICGTNEGDLVVDFFSGSGTTAVVCKDIHRNFICFEKRKDYYENSLKRLNEIPVISSNPGQLTLFDCCEDYV